VNDKLIIAYAKLIAEEVPEGLKYMKTLIESRERKAFEAGRQGIGIMDFMTIPPIRKVEGQLTFNEFDDYKNSEEYRK